MIKWLGAAGGAELAVIGLLGAALIFGTGTHYGKKGRDVVVSRKAMMEEEFLKAREEHLVKIKPDMEVTAVVRTVLQWGAFVSLPDFGDVEGVVHMSEASHDLRCECRSEQP